MQPHVNRAWNYTSITSANVCNVWCGDGHAKKKKNWLEIEREVFGRTWPSGQRRNKHFSTWTTFSRKISPGQNVCLHRNLKEFCTIEMSIKFLHIALILFFSGLCGTMWQCTWIKSSKKAFDLETFWNFFVSGCGYCNILNWQDKKEKQHILTSKTAYE